MKAVPSKTTMPILECILIDASANEIKFTSNDMELGIETKVEGDILEKGIIALDAKIFLKLYVSFLIMTRLPSQQTINFRQSLPVKSKVQYFRKSGDDFFLSSLCRKNDSITISDLLLKEIIRQTIFPLHQMIQTG